MAVVPPGGYDNLVNALAASFTVHYVHRRGRGASGPQGHPYRIERELADVAAVLMATGARAVFGHSYGGLLALRSALHDPDGRILTSSPTNLPHRSTEPSRRTTAPRSPARSTASSTHGRSRCCSAACTSAAPSTGSPHRSAWPSTGRCWPPSVGPCTPPCQPCRVRPVTPPGSTDGNRLRRHHRADTDPARRAGTVLAAVQRHGHRRNTAARPAAGDARTGPQRAPSAMRPRSSPPPPPSWRTTSPSATTVRRPRRPSGPTRGSWRRCGASPGSGPTAGPAR